ncbi:MAG: MSCRAMM family adhesin SdrC, partial [Flavobacteriales bacterium]|nr:MSCRAMM family adhesin SdrC [Flavobacteriales bacterium]
MKKIILTVGMFIAMAGISYAQAPEEFNYQAVARDVSGNVIPNQTIGVEISILESSSSGTVIYTETHAPTTNNFGLLNLNIGRGTIVSGTFNTIDWANNNYFVQISMDMTGGTNYNIMGTSQLISVPYALHAKTANSVANDMVDDADADPTNELQTLTISNDTIYISNGNHALLPSAVDTDEQTLMLSNDSLFISNGNGVSLSTYAVDMVDDADNDPTNEIETWSTLSGIPADLADGIDNVDDADADPSNELQDISLSGTNLSITSGSTVDLSALQDGVNDADANPTNEIQDISLTGTNLSITSGSTVDLSALQDGVNDADADATNEIQDISLTGTNLSITSGSTVDLSALQDGVNDADADATNEIQDISLTGTNLSITSGSTVDLSALQDGVNDADANPT